MHLKCYRLVATTTTATSTMMRITLMGRWKRRRSMMKPIHSLMFNQLTHVNNNNNEHRHSQKRHKLINNNRNYISALRRRMKHTFRRSQSVFCGSLGQSVSQSVSHHFQLLLTHIFYAIAASAQSLVALALLLALLLSRLARYLSRIFAYIFHELAPDRQAGRHSSFYTQSINYCYFP